MRRRRLISALGGAAASLVSWPLLARAEHAMPVIGFLSGGSEKSDALRLAGFWKGLNESGYVAGQNVAFEYRWAEGHYDRLEAFSADLVRHQVTAIAAIGG